MKLYTPPHAPENEEKVASLIEAFRVGAKITPVVTQGLFAICGSHRIAAYEEAWQRWDMEEPGWENSPEPELDVVEIDDETWERACEQNGVEHLDDLWDFNDICRAVFDATDDEEIRSALADQM